MWFALVQLETMEANNKVDRAMTMLARRMGRSFRGEKLGSKYGVAEN